MTPVRTTLLVLGVVVAGWCATGTAVRATYGAHTTADEPQYLLSAISLWEDRDLDIADELRAERWRAFHSPASLPEQTKPLDGGRRLSPHDPLLPLVLAVPMGLGGWVAAKLTLAAMAGACAAGTAWVAHRRLGVPLRFAATGVGVFALSPPLAMYATQVYPELPAALAVTVAVGCLTAPRLTPKVMGVLGATVVALPWLSVKYVPVAAAITVVGALGLRRQGRRRDLWSALALLALAGVLYLVAHRLIYGGWTVYASGDEFTGGEATVMGVETNLVGRSRRIAGLLVDRDFGLVPWQPAYLLAVLAVGALVRTRPRWWLAVLATGVAGWLVATFAALTMQGYWWPGRQVVVVAPTLVLVTVWWAAGSARRRRALHVAGAVGAVAFLWVVAEGVAEHLTLIVDFATTSNPLYRAWRPFLPDGRSTATGHLALTAGWAVVLAGLLVAGWRTAQPHRPEPSCEPVAGGR